MIFKLLFLTGAIALAIPSFSLPVISFNFDGKGIAMSFDLGVMREFHRHLKKNVQPQYYFSGSSSGSIAATFFACNGVNAETLDSIEKHFERLTHNVANSDNSLSSLKLFLGVPPETAIEKVYPVLDIATQNKACIPKTPLLLIAANSEVDGRFMSGDRKKWLGSPFSGKEDKKVNQNRYEVLDKEGNLIAKSCTYFVNPSMFEVIKQVDEKERLCDVFVMTTPEQLYKGVLASIKEPTYFYPEPETEMKNIISISPPKNPREYIGGWVQISPVQDIIRGLFARDEKVWAFSTGRNYFTPLQQTILKNWFYGMSLNELMLQSWYWSSYRLPISRNLGTYLASKNITASLQFQSGEKSMRECFKSKECAPSEILNNKIPANGLGYLIPEFNKDARGREIKMKRGIEKDLFDL